MLNKKKVLDRLRQRAQVALSDLNASPPTSQIAADDLIQELRLYHTELELQLEDLAQAHIQLEQAHERYVSLFEFAPIGYVVLDLDGRITATNLKARVQCGIKDNNWKGGPFREYIYVDDREDYDRHIQSVIGSADTQETEARVYGPDNTVFHARLTTQCCGKQPALSLRTAITDISAIKRAQDTLVETLEREQRLNQLQKRVLSVIAHEFRTPLAVIISSAELLEKFGDRMSDAKRDKRLRSIRNLAWYINDLVQDVRGIMNGDEEPITLHVTTFELFPFVRDIVDDMESMSEKERRLTLETPVVSEALRVTWDENLIRGILHNLISNALKYSEDAVTIQVDSGDEGVRLQVSDCGRGISATDLPHIFEPFYRGANIKRIHGTGVGLYVARKAALAHSGTLTCRSVEGSGTTMTVTLPQHCADGA